MLLGYVYKLRPKQVQVVKLFETPKPESTGSKRRQHKALKSKRGVPGNLGTQLDLFFQDNNNGTIVEVVNLLTYSEESVK
ncbi:hypothetical protein [Fischerella thermalis]|uniref:Uncharacterized protein n=1 Tax=Fischerella thermalis JSC-11 TaxID=741277 RepID=G6FPI9_9CYAN|nr:hypothetical protein [Fischerella thermalis]PLZ22375.1 hypothetical protein CBP30_06260 [Fischerella thermalis WC157]PLZ30477.1 hypothetical protein CBP28_08000 [Fischerella thermalis WC559]PLZ52077.1 hypothetical protein CBP24_19285 [Fischerella thermalis WC439]PMB02814.1 hypothetical protein CI592_15695 [Fischerella thermalis CCMEE 5328]EHC18789.1 hypothetical protein FJSC11DRAFT_0769 [Fischerella thermalis JSC-11]